MENKVREIYKDDFTEYLLCLALDVGEGMLKNGGEVSRVEDTIERICRAYGAVHVEVFTIISVINAAVRMPDGSYSSQLRRVRQTRNNLNTLERLNSLSRKICAQTPSLDDFDDMLHELKKEQPYPAWVHFAASPIAVAVFCFFFGGGVVDALVTAVIGLLIAFILEYPSARLNSMAKTVISSFCAATIAGVAAIFLPSLNVDAIIIGAIMLLVPGLMFGTAMRDLLCGDLIAGTLKILQALIQTLMIGFGYLLSYALIKENLLPTALPATDDLALVQIIVSPITSIVFAIVFKINKKHLISGAVNGLISYAIFIGMNMITDSFFWAAFVCSVASALYAEINARIVKAPSIVLLIPGVIPIVPGGCLYRSVRDFVCGMNVSAITELGDAAAIALGMAGGIVSLTIVYSMVNDFIAKKRDKYKNAN